MSNDIAHTLSEYIGAAAACGLASWDFLNRWTVRGDHALVFFLSASSLLHLALRKSLGDAAWLATITLLSVYLSSLAAVTIAYRLSPWHPLAQYPGPALWRVSSLYLSCNSLTGRRHHILDRLYEQYGPFLRIGPNLLSINSPAATAIYQTMEKSEAYRRPARIKVTTMFFKNKTEKLHRERKKIWAMLFTPSGQMELMPLLEKRTWELMQCLERRQSQSTDGAVDLGMAIAHWSYDSMGDMVFGGCNKYEMMKHRISYFLPRIVPQGGTVIDGKYIPEHTITHDCKPLPRYEVKVHPRYLRDPPALQSYRLKRWLDGGLGPDTKTNKGAIASFSFGPHACVAKNFAYQAMRLVLARLIVAYDMSLPKGFDIKGFHDGILNMRTTILEKKLYVCVERRPGVDLDKAF
ncbi:cytochrome P450 [Fomes fomentarius]|nr:cytochrome P450 [Fomes fomentarius]